MEISGHLNLVPFLNYFDRDYMRCNAEYVIEKAKGYNTLLVAMILSMTATILIVSLYMAKHFMESSAAKEYSKIEEKEKK